MDKKIKNYDILKGEVLTGSSLLRKKNSNKNRHDKN